MAEIQLKLMDTWLRVQGGVRFITETGLAALLAYVSGHLFWFILSPSYSVSMLSDRPLPAPLTGMVSQLSLDRTLLVNANPFARSAPAVIVEAPETQLNLKLSGLMMSSHESGGSAQITTPNNRTQRYVRGAEILEGVFLERILSDRVILNRNGVSEVLMLNGRSPGLSVLGEAAQRVADTTGSEVVSASQKGVTGTIASSEALLRTVRLTPIETDDGLYGFQLVPQGSKAALQRAGLQSGDILIAVNGVQVRTIDFAEMIDEIRSGSSVRLQLERSDVITDLLLNFED